MKLLHLGLHQDTRLAFPHSVVEIWSLNGKRRLSVPWLFPDGSWVMSQGVLRSTSRNQRLFPGHTAVCNKRK